MAALLTRTAGVLAAALLLTTGTPAAGQTRPVSPVSRPRQPPPAPSTFVTVNGAYQLAAEDFSDGATFRVYAEDGRFSNDYAGAAGPAFDVSGGILLFRRLAAAIGVSRFSHSTSATFSGSVPHPFFFNRGRPLGSDVTGLKREQLAVHFQARLVFPLTGRLQLMAFGGPTFFRVKQDVINDFDYSEEYPYDVVTFDQAVIVRASASKLGFNAGGDIAYFFTPQLGIGFSAQVSGATVDVTSASGGVLPLKVGGVQTGGGLRLRF